MVPSFSTITSQLCGNLLYETAGILYRVKGALFGAAECLEAAFENGLHLGGVVVANRREGPVEVQLQVTQGDTTVVDSGYSLEASDHSGSSISIDDAWNDRVARYTVTVSLHSGMADSFTYTGDQSDGGCTGAYIEIRATTIAFSNHHDPDGAACSSTN